MKRFYSLLFLVLIGTLIFAVQGSATPFPNPAPGILGDDLDDPGIFSHDALVVNLELFDLAETLTGGGFGFEFGFHFDGADVTNSDNLITIFDTEDDVGFPQAAAINFPDGLVVDVDAGFSTESTFTGDGNIGFYLHLDDFPTIFTDPTLNPDGIDFAATYPILPDLDFLDFVIGFWLPIDDGNGEVINVPLAFEATGGITPVPEPATFLLLGTGLLGLAGGLRRKLKK